MDPIRGSGPPSPGNGGEGPSFLNSVAKRVEGLFHSISWLFSDRAEIVRAPEVIIQTWVDSSNQGDREDYKVAQEVILSFLKDKSQNSLYLRGLNIKNLPDIWSIPDIQNRLKELTIRSCQTFNTLPEGVSKCKALTILDLQGCIALKALPESISKCRALKALGLEGCTALTFIPSSIVELPELFFLDFSFCSAFEALPQGISRCKTLSELHLRGCKSLVELPELPNGCNVNTEGCFFLLKSSPSNRALNSFAHITRYFLPTEDARKNFLKDTAGLQKRIPVLSKDMEKGDWAKILDKDELETLPLTALLALYDNKITGEQFTTLMIYWSAFSQLPRDQIVIKSIFDVNGEVDPDVKKWIKATLGGELGEASTLDAQLSFFFRKMKERPKSEQVFLYISQDTYSQISEERAEKRAKEEAAAVNPKPEDKKFLAELEEAFLEKHQGDIRSTITSRGRFNVLHQFFHLNEPYRMIPSLGMMQTILEAQRKETTITITSVIGLSSVEDIVNNALESTREMALPFPGVAFPETADQLSVLFYIDFIFHDFYHSMLANAVPKKWQKAFVEVGEVALGLAEEEQDKDVKEFLGEFRERLIDMEHPGFRSISDNRSMPDRGKFMYALFTMIRNACVRLLPYDPLEAAKDATYEEKRQEMISANTDAKKRGVIKRLVDKLERQGFWEAHGFAPEEIQF